jgi:hypothetical protein
MEKYISRSWMHTPKFIRPKAIFRGAGKKNKCLTSGLDKGGLKS